MKKKNVVKKNVREKKTHSRTPIRVVHKTKPEEIKTVTEEVKPDIVEKETVRKQNKRPKPAIVDIVADGVENNEQNN